MLYPTQHTVSGSCDKWRSPASEKDTNHRNNSFIFIHLNSIYLCFSDPEGGYGPQDTEHVNSINSIDIHANTYKQCKIKKYNATTVESAVVKKLTNISNSDIHFSYIIL